MRTALLLASTLLGAALLAGCGSTCDASSCTGCCDSAGVCQAPSAQACGLGGGACQACLGAQQCVQGVCGFAGSGGAGSGNGGNASGSAGASGSTSSSGSNGNPTTTSGSSGASSSGGSTGTGGGQDTAAPVLVGTSVSPPSVDVSNGPQDVTVTLHITDDVLGLSANTAVSVQLASPPPGTQSGPVDNLFAESRVGGTPQDGEYALHYTIPPYVQPGTWTLGALELYDGAAHTRSYQPADLVQAGLQIALQVTSSPVDSAPPTLLGAAARPTTVDAASSDQTVTVTLHVTDDLAGVAHDLGTTMVFSGPGSQRLYAGFSDNDRTSGTALDGIYTVALDVPQLTPAGTYALTELDLYDGAGNGLDYDASRLQASGIGASFTVQ
jgi:hypothetical protein